MIEEFEGSSAADLSAAVHQAMKALDLAYEAGKASPRSAPHHPFVEKSRSDPLVGSLLQRIEACENRSVYRLTKKTRNRYAELLLRDLFALHRPRRVDRRRLTQLFEELDEIPIPGRPAH